MLSLLWVWVEDSMVFFTTEAISQHKLLVLEEEV